MQAVKHVFKHGEGKERKGETSGSRKARVIFPVMLVLFLLFLLATLLFQGLVEVAFRLLFWSVVFPVEIFLPIVSINFVMSTIPIS